MQYRLRSKKRRAALFQLEQGLGFNRNTAGQRVDAYGAARGDVLNAKQIRQKLGSTSVILTHVTLNLPFTIWMMRSFFDEAPRSLEAAAMLDGCSRLRSFFKIALPLCSSGLVATGILATIHYVRRYGENELRCRQDGLPLVVRPVFTQIPERASQIAAIDEVVPMMLYGRLDGMDYISDVIPFDRAVEGIEMFKERRNKKKIVFTMP